jgi:hypothetical protein
MPGAAAPDPSAPLRCRTMDLRRLRAGEWLAAVSGVALLVSLFLPWYEHEVCAVLQSDTSTFGGCPTVSAWEAFTAIDVLLALVAASGIVLAIVTATHRVPAVPVAVSALVTIAGAAGLLLVLWRMLDVPAGWIDRQAGIWLALASSLGIIAGAFVAMRDEIRPAGTPLEIEAIPAPRP